ncbi:hypothetical protein WJX72_008810 [[Myrmecia] bisecta]|uniref:Protein RER1 n=1 Tax=[Myrmecia] bisecta TaxID=41462 RepID=A0AAW1PM66_9CHLO
MNSFDADNQGVNNPLTNNKFVKAVQQRYQYYLDRSTPHAYARWFGLLVVIAIYTLRAFWLRGFYIVSYGLGIYNLNLLLGFLSPQVDPELEGPSLPSKNSDEFRPFVRRLPEFKFWYSSFKAFVIGFIMTFFPIFNVPVFWPILLLYWLVLFFITMKRQIKHMIKYKYLPFNLGKKKYKGGKDTARK